MGLNATLIANADTQVLWKLAYKICWKIDLFEPFFLLELVTHGEVR